MLRIRLQRIGRKKKPNYRIIVVEHTAAATKSKYVEQLGHYNPLSKKDAFQIDQEKFLQWIKKGAMPTNTTARLMKGMGVKDMEPFIYEMKSRGKKKEAKAAAEAAGQAKPAAAPQAAPQS